MSSLFAGRSCTGLTTIVCLWLNVPEFAFRSLLQILQLHDKLLGLLYHIAAPEGKVLRARFIVYVDESSLSFRLTKCISIT